MTPIWLDKHGRRVPTRACHVPNCDREWAVRRYRLRHLIASGWKPMYVVNLCGHGQQFIPWSDEDG